MGASAKRPEPRAGLDLRLSLAPLTITNSAAIVCPIGLYEAQCNFTPPGGESMSGEQLPYSIREPRKNRSPMKLRPTPSHDS